MMTPERWNQVQLIFEMALEKIEPERDAYLKKACSQDPDLYDEVVSLLKADSQEHALLQGHAFDGVEPEALTDLLSLEGSDVGPYRLIQQIGEGGMGMVFLAERTDGVFDQPVALKLIKRGMDTDQIIRRFNLERRILGRLQHANIARIYDGGVTGDGRSYFVMEYVDGVPIDTYCDTNRLSVDDRLTLFVTVCKAVLFAHANLVVHRDLKPENILVTQDGTVKLLDFGIAKLLEEDDNFSTMTGPGKRILTPAYASPEQVRGDAISTSSDIYSLGVILYELLVGQKPGEVQPQSSLEPERPSTRFEREMKRAGDTTAESVSQARRTQPNKLRRLLSGDLDVICLKALRPDPERRYGSVEAFSEDIQRFRNGQPVLARPETPLYLIGKFVSRYKAGVVSVCAGLMLVAGLVGFYSYQLSQERDKAQLEAEKAQTIAEFMQGIFEVSSPSQAKGESITARELLDQGAERLATDLEDQPEIQAEMLDVIGNVYRELGLLQRADSMLTQSFENKKSLYGENSFELAITLNALGVTRRMLGNYSGADSVYREALRLQRAHYEGENEDMAETLANLAVVVGRLGDQKEAEAMVREALRQRIILLGPDHIEVAATMNNLAVQLYRRDELEAADSLFTEVTRILQETVGESHPGVASTLNNRAAIQSKLGDEEESLRLYSASLDVKKNVYGEEHPSLIITMNNVGSSLFQLDRFEESEAIIQQAIDLGNRLFKEPHPEVANGLNHLANLRSATGELEAALLLRQEALQMRKTILGMQHPDYITNLKAVATLHSKMGNEELAESLLATLENEEAP